MIAIASGQISPSTGRELLSMTSLSPEYQYNLGAMYANGRGVMPNDKEAVEWYRLAAEQGHAKAQYNLGYMYANGRGVIQDDKEAVKWYRLAAEQGNAEAQNYLVLMCANGDAVKLMADRLADRQSLMREEKEQGAATTPPI